MPDHKGEARYGDVKNVVSITEISGADALQQPRERVGYYGRLRRELWGKSIRAPCKW